MTQLPRQKNGRYTAQVIVDIPASAIQIALRDLERDHQTTFSESTDFDVLVGRRRYPPKRLLGRAGEIHYGIPFTPDDFAGGDDSVCFRVLRDAGYAVVPKLDTSRPRRYWWVNHKQTFSSEVPGGYIWSPKRKRDGSRNQHYDNMTLCAPGDQIVSFAFAAVQANGVITSWVEEAERPENFSTDWSTDGWLVRVTWKRWSEPLRIKDHIARVRDLLPSRHSPLQADSGDGQQSAYLSEISEGLYLAVMALGDREAVIAGSRAAEEAAESDRVAHDPSLTGSTREAVIQARVGQGQFRVAVLRTRGACPFTGVTDHRLLVASHIKPWRSSCDTEKVDPDNGLALTPTMDRLFDQGLVTFDDDGRLLVLNATVAEILERLCVSLETQLPTPSQRQRAYLAHHRTEVFGK